MAFLATNGIADRPRAGSTPLFVACAITLVVVGLLCLLPRSDVAPSHLEACPESPGGLRDRRFGIIEEPAGLPPEVVALGERLFHDPLLSRDRTVSCATCHDLSQGGDDGLPQSIGVGGRIGTINAPTVLNACLNPAQFWDGRAANLVEQIDGPIHHPVEMDCDWPTIIQRLEDHGDYPGLFDKAFGGRPTPERIRQAIAKFEESLVTPDAPFDRWLLGDDEALAPQAEEGLELFKRHGCVSCHQGRGVGGNVFERLGLMREYFESQREPRPADLGRFNHTKDERDRHVFRVPSLRNVELTGPYLHDGSAKTLADAVRVMLRHQVGVPEVSEHEVKRLTEFLRSLTGRQPGEAL